MTLVTVWNTWRWWCCSFKCLNTKYQLCRRFIKPYKSILPKSIAASFFYLSLFSLSLFLHPSLCPPSLPVYSFSFPPSLPPSLLSAMQMCFLWFCHQRLISTLLGALFIPPADRGEKKERERHEEGKWEWETDRLRQKLGIEKTNVVKRESEKAGKEEERWETCSLKREAGREKTRVNRDRREKTETV